MTTAVVQHCNEAKAPRRQSSLIQSGPHKQIKRMTAYPESIHQVAYTTNVVSVSTSRSRDAPTSHLSLVSTKNYNVSVLRGGCLSLVLAIYVSCPRHYFAQILQATLIKRAKSASLYYGSVTTNME